MLIDSDKYFLVVSRYIELNPVRSNMLKHPAEYPWFSFHKNALGKDIKLITCHECYLMLGKNEEDRQYAYLNLFEHKTPDYKVNEVRSALNVHGY